MMILAQIALPPLVHHIFALTFGLAQSYVGVYPNLTGNVKGFEAMKVVALGQVSGLKVPRTGWESSRLSIRTTDPPVRID